MTYYLNTQNIAALKSFQKQLILITNTNKVNITYNHGDNM